MRQLKSLLSQLRSSQEHGQSIVLIAFSFIGLLAMVGLAVDVGFVYARRAQLSNAVDAATLAGVVELNRDVNERQNALNRAAAFLSANHIPEPAIENTLDNSLFAFDAEQDSATLGARTFALTVTIPVELHFLRVIGFTSVDLTESATASNFPLADIYASRRVETGALSTSNQAVFGPQLWTNFGDPFSSWGSNAPAFRARWLGDPTQNIYRYRILIPDDYEDQLCPGGNGAGSLCDVVRVELFDADSHNKSGNSANVVRTQAAQNYGLSAIESRSCSSSQVNPCLIATGEEQLMNSPHNLKDDQINLWWFLRIDENRGNASGDPNAGGEPSNYTSAYSTITRYTLYFFQRTASGTIQRVNLATYHGKSGDWGRDLQFSSGDAQRRYEHLWTDMRWISPGGEKSLGEPPSGHPDNPNNQAQIYTTCDTSVNRPGRHGCTPDAAGPGKGFEIDISEDLASIVRDEGSGARYIYMEVETLSGGSENGFEIWAGPRNYVHSVNSDVNVRNVQVTNNPSSHSSRGVTIFGLGHLPMNSNYGNRVEIPLIYVGPEYAGTSVFVTNFDSDSSASGPVHFYFDTIARADWEKSFSHPNGTQDDDGQRNARGQDGTTRCLIGGCDNRFVDPPYRIDIPTYTDECDSNPNEDICTPFYGGRLMVSYNGGQHDTYHWNISLSGLPYLIR